VVNVEFPDQPEEQAVIHTIERIAERLHGRRESNEERMERMFNEPDVAEVA
jgi:hypothetical protein